MSFVATALQLLREKRRRLAPILVACAVLLVGSRLSAVVPRDVSLRYDLGPEHASLTEARIGYRHEGEEVQAVRFAYAEGAPSTLDHRVTLAPGRYEVVADVRAGGATRSIVRSLEVPADGVVRLPLFEADQAAPGATP